MNLEYKVLCESYCQAERSKAAGIRVFVGNCPAISGLIPSAQFVSSPCGLHQTY